jgi:hypothetical protein
LIVFGGVKIINRVSPAFLVPAVLSVFFIYIGIFASPRKNDPGELLSVFPYSLAGRWGGWVSLGLTCHPCQPMTLNTTTPSLTVVWISPDPSKVQTLSRIEQALMGSTLDLTILALCGSGCDWAEVEHSAEKFGPSLSAHK